MTTISVRSLSIFLVGILFLSGCGRGAADHYQGYVEGDFLQIAPQVSGKLTELSVAKGDRVKKGTKLFSLDETPEKAALGEAEAALGEARANLADLQKGLRPSEMAALSAQLEEAKASLQLAERNFERERDLAASKATSKQAFDEARSRKAESEQTVARLEAELETAKLGARSDRIEAAQAAVRGKEAALDKAKWEFEQTSRDAPSDGVIFDTLFYEGEWIAAGNSVVTLLPPERVKVKLYIPESELSKISIDQEANIRMDGGDMVKGRVKYIAGQAEFTPPVIYSRESRSKLMYLVELSLSDEASLKLHPGQPVEVSLLR